LYAQLPEPKSVWEYFLKITQIPRGSNQEGESFRHKQILAYLKKTAEELGCETYVDAGDNLIIRKPAHPGRDMNLYVRNRL
jgi:singapore isolate B (sub-type 7) whole genome shotgun sequence assembly, scaffold_3